MKKTLILSAIMLFFFVQSRGQEKIYLWKTQFNASEILGGKDASFGPQGPQNNLTKLIDNPVGYDDAFRAIGTIYSDKSFTDIKDFLNSHSSYVPIPILDSINITYYLAYGLDIVDKQFKKDSNYIKFKKGFLSLNTVKEKKIFLNDYDVYKEALENSKYEKSNTNSFNISDEKNKSFSLGVSGSLVEQIKKGANVNINATLSNKISAIVKKYSKVSSAKYYEISFQSNFIGITSDIFNYYYHNPIELEKFKDNFSKTLKNFFPKDDVAIVAKSAIIEAQFQYNSKDSFELELGTTIDANIEAENKNKVPSIKAAIAAEFNKSTSHIFELVSNQGFYNIRYAKVDELEIGNGVPPQK